MKPRRLKVVLGLLMGLLVASAAMLTAIQFAVMRQLPADRSPVVAKYPPHVLRLTWLFYEGQRDMILEPLSIWTFVKVLGPSRRRRGPLGGYIAHMAAQFMVERSPTTIRRGLGRLTAELASQIWVSRHWSTEEAMSTILATGYFQHGFYGFEQASKGYFDAPSDQLSDPEVAILLGMHKTGSRLDPWCHRDAAWRATATFLLGTGKASTSSGILKRLRPAPKDACAK